MSVSCSISYECVLKYSVLSSLKRLACLVTHRMVACFRLASSHCNRHLEAYLLHIGVLFNDKKDGSIHVYTRRKLQVNVTPTYKTVKQCGIKHKNYRLSLKTSKVNGAWLSVPFIVRLCSLWVGGLEMVCLQQTGI